jgi:hypothetical protein
LSIDEVLPVRPALLANHWQSSIRLAITDPNRQSSINRNSQIAKSQML